MCEKLIGYWKLDRAENLDDFMKDAKVGYVLRKIVQNLTIYIEIIKNSEEEWQLNYLSTFKDHKVTFKVGERFKKTTGDGKEVMVCYNFDGDKLKYEEEPLKKGEVGNKYVIEVLDDGTLLETVATVPNNVILRRYYNSHKK